MSRSFSVVISTYNRGASLLLTLQALTHLDHPCFEVVVVNGPSTDETEDVLRTWSHAIKVVRTAERNLSASRNLGVAAAGGDVVAFIDDDAYPDPAWLTHLDAAFANPEVAAAGGPVLDQTGAAWQARFSLANRRGDTWLIDGPNPTESFGSPWSDTFVYTRGTNSSFRREALLEVGGFDEEYDFYLDETDVCVRLLDRGWLVAALDDGIVFHKSLPSDVQTEQRALCVRFSVVKNRLYFALRHGRRDHSLLELLHDAEQFVERHRQDMQSNVAHGLLDAADLEQYDADARRAIDVALADALAGGPRTRTAAWFDADPRPLRPFPTLRPDGGRLRLVFVSREYPPGPVNGIGRFVAVLAAGLGRRGHDAHVVTESATHRRIDFENHVWVHRVPVEPGSAPADLDLPARIGDYAASVAAEVERIAERRAIDLVQFPAWDAEGAVIARGGSYRTVLSLHTPLLKVAELDETFPAEGSEVRRIAAAERDLYRSACAYLANGPSVVAEVERCYDVALDPPPAMVPHGLPPVRPAPSLAPASAQSASGELGGGHEAPAVLFVGRLEHRKGIDTLLEAAPAILASCPDAVITVVGDDTIPAPGGGTYRQRFEAAWHGDHGAGEAAAGPGGTAGVVSRVRFLGRVEEEELVRQYAACDVLVAPSRYESFGLVLLEAMRHGKAVVAGDTGGIRDIVDGNGVLVTPGDAAVLADAVTGLLVQPERRARMGARSLELFDERYSDERMVDGVERFHRRVVAGTVSAT